MKKTMPTTRPMIATTIFVCLIIVSFASYNAGLAGNKDISSTTSDTSTNPHKDSLAPDQPYDVYLPILYRWQTPPMVTLTSARTTDTAGNEQNVFLPGDTIRYTAGGRNDYPVNVSVTLRWEQENPCGVILVFSETLNLPPGNWQHVTTRTVDNCPGIYTSTVRVTNMTQAAALAVLDVVNPPTIVEINNQQGFDRCHLPSVPQMQTWWDTSPYWVFNIYLGGSMFYCDTEIPDAFWVHQVAGQGWKFILTWVGPQAPCSPFREKMSATTSTARQQGRAEASAAADAASRMGLRGNRVIYYDLEAYGQSASSECRAAAAAFMRGWTERLHDLGYLAGGYGAPATSHIADWANNSPPPDYVWIAHWLTPPRYQNDATVWSSYLSNSLWGNHQRIRQYAGGHNESWGGTTLDMDCNVLDGAVTTLPLGPAGSGVDSAGQNTGTGQAVQVAPTPALRDVQLLTADMGWVLQGERLLVTPDGGNTWQDITPPQAGAEPILGAQMLDRQQGWVVRQGEAVDRLVIQKTDDGGASWQSAGLQLPPSAWDGSPVAEAIPDFIDGNTGWLALRLQSGSSFSLGRLFATQDGGQAWEERNLPIGEAVHFSDSRLGWVAGGPGGEQRYRTEDGGFTWIAENDSSPQALTQPRSFSGQPVTQEASAGGTQWIVVQDGRCSGEKSGTEGAAPLLCYQRSSLYTSTDGGSSWTEITPLIR